MGTTDKEETVPWVQQLPLGIHSFVPEINISEHEIAPDEKIRNLTLTLSSPPGTARLHNVKEETPS